MNQKTVALIFSSYIPNYIRRMLVTILALIIFGFGLTPEITLALQTNQNSIQPYLDRVINQLTEFKLDNGLKFIVLERHQAPVVSFLTYADVGGIDEPDGKTGVAHFLEHLAFKGTKRIGTTDYNQEKPLLEKLEKLDQQIRDIKNSGNSANSDKKTELTNLENEFKNLESQALKLVKQNEMGQIVEQAGGTGLNATTSSEATRYFYSFPSNKLELWMSLESERFLEPVFREFYKERDVILEERRLRVDNSPIGTMVEKFTDTAFKIHPYRRPVIGYDQDIRNLSPTDVAEFFKSYYTPSNLTIAVVGDVNPTEVKRLAQIYFGRYPAQPKPQQKLPVEPKQTAPREFTLELVSQPWYLEGYHRPGIAHPDNVVYDIIGSLLTDGRTSRLYKSLVEKQGVALAAEGYNGFPGDKNPNLMFFYVLSAPNKTLDDVAVALRAELEKMKTEPVSLQELERVKTQARVGLLKTLNSNMGMAEQLVEYEVKTGSWRNLFKELEKIAAVTPQDIQRVAQATFKPENRTVGKLLSKKG